MLTVETIGRIRRAHFVEQKGLRQIARELHVSRKTVRKAVRREATEFRYARRSQPQPRLGAFVARLAAMLEANHQRPRRERLTARRLYELLRSEGYAGAYDSVQRQVRSWRRERGKTGEVFIPLWFAPGEAYQFDWSHEVVVLGGVTTTVKAAHVRLCHSRMFLIQAYPRETQEMVFDAHDRAFRLFGGACRRGIYDNMKTAVDAVFVGKERRFNRRFEQMCSHYLVEPVACTPVAGWEKGQVENQVGNARERFFTPRLRFAGYGELNAWLAERCVAHARAALHPEQKDRTIRSVFEAERASLIAYPGPFDGFQEIDVAVSKSSLVRFDHNRYSAAAKAARRPAQLRAYADRVVLWQDGEIVAEHARRFGREHTVYDPWHYLPVLARKPGALRNGQPFRDWALPAGLAEVRRHLADHADGDRQFVDILAAVAEDGIEAVEAACRDALAANLHSRDVVLNMLARQRQPAAVAPVATPIGMRLAIEPVADCARYDALRRALGVS
ncbi:MAG: IS21 family transposase [Alphaproteobacteria bacterium]|nr:IS21 family transposase [Alphaproteobacteria bacterium]